MKNLELWNKVSKTDPAFTKKANVGGNKITAIAPQYQIMNATEQFGVYGDNWGFSDLEFDYTLQEKGLVILNAIFYFPGGQFPIKNSVKLYKDGAQTKIDDDFAKKVETDTLTKALSKLGFNADIFMGAYDDIKYVESMTKEFRAQKNPKVKEIMDKIEDGDAAWIRQEWGGKVKECWLDLESEAIDSLNLMLELDTKFQKNLPQYKDCIESGKKTAEVLIQFLETKGKLFESHKQQIRNLEVK